MRNQQDSGTLRRKLYLIYHQDGLLDIAFGTTLLALGAVILTELTAFIGLVGIPVTMYLPLKQGISIPRMGYIRFVPEREQRFGLGLTVAMGLIALIGVLTFRAFAGTLPPQIVGTIQAPCQWPLAWGSACCWRAWRFS